MTEYDSIEMVHKIQQKFDMHTVGRRFMICIGFVDVGLLVVFYRFFKFDVQ